MIALSTSLIPRRPEEPDSEAARLERLLDTEVAAYELDCRIPLGELEPLAMGLRRAGREITSLHNFCPLPRDLRGTPGSEPLLASSPDPEERQAVVQATRRTLEWAARVEARAVVFLCGHVPVPEPRQAGIPADARARAQGKARAEIAPRHFDAVCLCLDRILRDAERLEISVALRNRRLPAEIPDLSELRRLLREFEGAPLGIWFAPADAPRHEEIGVPTAEETWATISKDLLGVHLNDRDGDRDRLPPGHGDTPWTEWVPRIPKSVPWVLDFEGGEEDPRRTIERLETWTRGDAKEWDPFRPAG